MIHNIEQTTNSIKESVLKFVQAKSIYLFGSHAYGTPNEESDIDISVVTPNDRRLKHVFERTIYQKGKVIYEQ